MRSFLFGYFLENGKKRTEKRELLPVSQAISERKHYKNGIVSISSTFYCRDAFHSRVIMKCIGANYFANFTRLKVVRFYCVKSWT